MFVKLFHQILDSSIADNRRLRHFFTDLLLCADPKGYVIMTESAIARRIGAPIEEVQWGIQELQKADPQSKTTDMDGARIEKLEGTGYGWRIVNFEEYRNMRSADDMREKGRIRVQRFREKKNGNACNAGNVTGNACNPKKRKKKNEEEEEDGGEEEESPPPKLDFPESPKHNPNRMATFKQVIEFAESQPMGIPRECSESFFDRMEAEGWVTPSGLPLNDWRARFRSWSTNWINNQRKAK